MTDHTTDTTQRGAIEHGGNAIRFAHRPGAADGAPIIVWLGGWRSDMEGGKALALDALARSRGWAMLRHDYSGHGISDGSIEDGTISLWTDESLAVLTERAPTGPVLLAGSSMGAWIALRMALALRERGEADRLRGLLLIAPAPDFVTRLMEPKLTDAEREALTTRGRFEEASDWSDEPNVWTAAFMADGREAAVLTGPLALGVPVHIVQGTDDAEVPVAHAELLLSHLPADEAAMTIVRGGDHRLSRPDDLSLIARLATDLVERGRGAGAPA